MKPACFILFVFFALSSMGQTKMIWSKAKRETPLILNNLRFDLQPINKTSTKGIFGNLCATTVFPVNYEIHFSPMRSLLELVLQTERSAVTTAVLNYQFGKFGFSFSIDNLPDKKSQPPSFEIIQKGNVLTIDDVSYKPGSPKFLQLATTINF
jgi:hypothetical protein